MRDWNNVDDRREATIEFANFMKDPKNAQIRQDCFKDPNKAKNQFKSVGKFESIPESVQFKMYDATDPKRQDLVVMVFPSAKGNDSAEATDIWMAAWQPWVALTPKPAQGKMRIWENVDDRRDATIDFANFIKDPKNAEIRKKCFDDPNEAKRQFASIGKFESIPESVQFKMYDATDPKRQDLVVMVFPSAKGNDSAEATDIWMAAWQPWVALTGKPGPK